MKIIAKKNRELALINARNTQNENKAETIELIVPEEYESYNKKIVFITDDGVVWDVITNNEYKITNAITKYKQVDFYIWLTKEVDGESIDFRTKTKTLNFYHNVDASDEITDEEIHGVNTVVNLLEEEIEKVENLDIEATKVGNTTTVTITKKDGTTESVEINDGADGQDGRDGQDGQDGYTPQKGIDYFTQQDKEEIEGDILNEVYTKSETDTLLEGKADVEDIPDVSNFITKDVNNLTNYTLKTNTGSLIDLEIDSTTYVVTLKLKNQDGTVISTDTIDLPLENVVVGGNYDSTNKKIVLTLENGNTVDIPVGDLIAGLQTEITSSNKLASDLVDDTNSGNKFVTTSEKQAWNAKYDKPSGGIPKTDLASDVQTSLGKADTALQSHQDISGKQDKTDNSLTTINKTIVGAINEVDSIAKGANQALVYGNYQTMITAFNALDDDVYNLGQNIYIITTEVPDLWISGIESTSSTYTYVDDETFANEIATNGYVQVGYYKISALETQKVDLTNYVTNTDYATSSKGGVIKCFNSDGLTTNNGTLITATKTYAQYNSGGNWMFVGKGTLENVITGKGLVSNTDYATDTVGGIIKTSSGNYATGLSNGQLSSLTKTYEDYTNARNQMFIGKGTLENVIKGKELDLKQLSTFDATKTQVLKNINGTLTWVDE